MRQKKILKELLLEIGKVTDVKNVTKICEKKKK